MRVAQMKRINWGRMPMSIRMGIAVAAGLFAAASLAGGASAEMFAPTKPAKPKTVTVTGCATKGFPDTCTMMEGPKGANYNISSANPAVPVGKKSTVKGTVTDKVSICGGTVLDNISWGPAKGKC